MEFALSFIHKHVSWRERSHKNCCPIHLSSYRQQPAMGSHFLDRKGLARIFIPIFFLFVALLLTQTAMTRRPTALNEKKSNSRMDCKSLKAHNTI